MKKTTISEILFILLILATIGLCIFIMWVMIHLPVI